MGSNNYNTKSTSGSQQGSGQQGSGQQGNASLSQQANDAKEALKSTVAETTATVKSSVADTASTVKQQARQAVNDAQHTASELVTEAKHTATEKLGEAKARAESAVDERKTQTADRLQGIAGALRETSTKLQDQEEDTFASYAATAADQVDKFSGYLRNQNVGDLLQDVESFARRQPELFLAGTLAAGFLLGRFFKSSAASQANQMQRYGQPTGNYGSPPQANQYGTPGYTQSHPSQPGQYDTGTGSSQYGSTEYQGRQDAYDPQSGRPNQRDWSSATDTGSQNSQTSSSTTVNTETKES